MTVRPTARWAVGVAAAALLLGAAGCTPGPQLGGGPGQGRRPEGLRLRRRRGRDDPGRRSAATPVELTGTMLDGTAWDIASTRGKVLVLNVWGSWCAPCVAEAPDLQKTWAELAGRQGAGRSSSASTSARTRPAGAAFAKKAGITYPSLSDESGVAILALQGKAPTVPTTLVLDTEGRIAARVNGPVTRQHPARPRRRRRRRVVTPAAGTAAVLAAGDTVTSGALPLAVAVAAFAGLVSFASPACCRWCRASSATSPA